MTVLERESRPNANVEANSQSRATNPSTTSLHGSGDGLGVTGYEATVDIYRNQGWLGAIPFAPGTKWPPPVGFTGYEGEYPSYPDICAWKAEHPVGNIGLRVPDSVIGIDVDAYIKDGQQKQGKECLAEAEHRWGALPSAPVSTSRDDGISGIRWFRVPPGTKLHTIVAFPDKGIAGGIEVIQWFHRYGIVWPSFHDKTGEQYRWEWDGQLLNLPPRPEDLPELPESWINGLHDDTLTQVVIGPDGPYDVPEAFTEGEPSGPVAQRLTKALNDLSGGSRHDNTRDAVLALLAMGQNEHPGVRYALETLGNAFADKVAPDRKAGRDEAVGEYKKFIFSKKTAKLLSGSLTGFLGAGGPPPNKGNDDTMTNGSETRSAENPWGVLDGAEFILDQPKDIPALWGEGDEILWADGEGLMIAGGQGLGKTTLAGLLLRGLLGLDSHVLGLPVNGSSQTILYLAMDRPRQIQRSLARQFTGAERDILKARVIFRPGPPLHDLAQQDELLAQMARDLDAGIVIVDSIKDAAVRLSEDAVGSGYNRARQRLLADGRNIVDLHHIVKRVEGTPSINDIYGSTWLTSGCGSVILLTGAPGDPIVGFHHVKQPAEPYGPFKLSHDGERGRLKIWHSVEPLDCLRGAGAKGLTAKQAAVMLYNVEKPTTADTEKARRRLDALRDANPATVLRVAGEKGKTETVWKAL
jgi:hypothetical protein